MCYHDVHVSHDRDVHAHHVCVPHRDVRDVRDVRHGVLHDDVLRARDRALCDRIHDLK